MKQLFVYFSLLVLLSSCDFNKRNSVSKIFWIDNPLETPITIHIDEEAHTIAAKSVLLLEIPSGLHRLEYNKEQVNFVVKPNSKEVIMNPTLSNYVFHHEMYSLEEEGAEEQADRFRETYLYDYYLESGDTIRVPFKLVNDLFIERTSYYWHLNPTEPYKEVDYISMEGSNLLSVVRSKMFRERNFYRHYEAFLPDNFQFPKNETKLSDLKPFEFMPENLRHCDCAGLDIILQLKLAQFDSLQIVDATEFKALYDRFSIKNRADRLETDCGPDYPNLGAESEYWIVRKALEKSILKLGVSNAFIVE
ncbi:hypothetical protein AwDysgo_08910 [Bacteroidales bacterium]|nr:hypothetical protein AwDysgo_08910 [Bacteroidales bacterium]